MSEDYKVEAALKLKGAEEAARDAKKASVEIARLGRELAKAARAAHELAGKRDQQNLARFGHQMRAVAGEALKQRRAAERAAAASRRAAAEAMRAQRASYQMMASVSSGFSRVGGAMTGVSRTIGRIGLGLGLLGAGAAYIGLRVARTMVTDIGLRALQANSQVEDMITSLASVRMYIEGVDFSTAQEGARGVYRELERLAAASPGTAADLATVYNAIYGPMRRAGTSLSQLTTLSQNAVSVGAALGVDYQQISRDMAMMATGAAGQDVKTFRLLRSMGLLTESTQEWNAMAQRDPGQAASRMVQMFQRLGGPAAEAYGRTWTGISSSFQDLMNQFTRLLTAPAFEVLKERLAAVVAYLQRHQTWIRSTLTTMGERLGSVFRRIIDRGQRAYEYILTHFDAIHARFDRLVTRVRDLIPALLTAGKVAGGVMVGTRVAGAGLSGLGMAGGALSALGTMGVGGGAAAAGGGGAAASALAAIAAVAAPVAIAFAAIGAAAVFVWQAFRDFGGSLMVLLRPLWTDLQGIGADLVVYFSGVWDILQPIFSYMGTFLTGVFITNWRNVLIVLRSFTTILRGVGRIMSWVGHTIIRPVFTRLSVAVIEVVDWFRRLQNAIQGFINWLRDHLPGFSDAPAGGMNSARGTIGRMRTAEDVWAGLGETRGGGAGSTTSPFGSTPSARPEVTVNQDLRGSTIRVEQSFRDSDPDRVLLQMRDALAGEAVRRISSPFVSPLTR